MLLPPHTPLLRRGLGPRRAYTATVGSITTFDAPRDRPERETEVLDRGLLAGAAEGVLAYHTHLAERHGRTGFAAWTHTVVYAELPAANRILGKTSFGHREPVKAAGTLSLRKPKPHVKGTVPFMSAPRLASGAMARRAVDEPKAELKGTVPFISVPRGIEVEVEYGALCAYMPGRVTDPAQLARLWTTAAAVVDAIVRAVEEEPELDPEVPVGPVPDTEYRRWVREGVARVAWTEPPADVDSAVAAYGRVVGGQARRFGWTAGLLLFVVATVLAAGALYAGVRLGLLYGGVFAAATGVWLLWRIVRAAFGTARELSADERHAHAWPWGLEAFVSGYAAARGLTVEHPELVQRRFDSPVRGRAVAALHGPDGHLLLWLDPSDQRWIVRVGDRVHAERADWTAAALDRVPVLA